MLRLNHLKKSYNKKTEILSDINYTFKEGILYPVLGRNGSGRTTLFECISEDIAIDSGTIETKEKSTIFLAAKQSILPMYVTGYEYIRFLCELKNIAIPADEFLDRVKMEENSRDTLIGELSFEDKKRLQLAAFLVQKPYVILFDEPFDYCDETYTNDFLEVLESVKKDHIILISTGLLEVAGKISDEFLVLNNGELNSVPKETLQIPEIRAAVLEIIGESNVENP
ncbi:MAG: ATP-binding cassette domain-containing protein [Lachnospira sp.]|nr:ATP-binding cassette domain-containing protein [Lachnospira sp.]